jgi:hypothetical protein
MAPPVVDTTTVIVGEARLYTAPMGTAAPLDTLATGTVWPSPWTFVGPTEEGVSLAVGSATTDIMIEEQATPVATPLVSSNVRVIVSLSGDTLETMKLVFGGGTITTQAAATGIIGKKTFTMLDSISTIMCGFEAVGVAGFWRRVIVPKVQSVADVTTPYRRAANNRAYPAELRAICARSEIIFGEMTAVAL